MTHFHPLTEGVIPISYSSADSSLSFVADVEEEWPNFFTRGVHPPVPVSAISITQLAVPSLTGPVDGELWLPNGLRTALELAGGCPAYEIVVERGSIRPLWLGRGFWATQGPLPARGMPGATATFTRDGWTQWAGAIEYRAIEAITEAQLNGSRAWTNPIVAAGRSLDLTDALSRLVESSTVRRMGYSLRFLVPELIGAVVESGAFVIRRWTGHIPSVDVFGPATSASFSRWRDCPKPGATDPA